MKIAVIYKSRYGATKQYAQWIAAALNAELLEKSSVKSRDLINYDIVVYGGGLYAGGIGGINLVTRNPCQKLVVFTVGLADPLTTDYTEILDKGLPKKLQSVIKVFHLRGGVDYAQLGFIHRMMMAMKKRMVVGNKTHEQLSEEDRLFIDTYGKKVDFINRESIQPLVDYVKDVIRLLPSGQ